MQNSRLILIMAFLGGMALMSMELIFPKMSMIWFGNVLGVWSANLVMALAVIAFGYFVGARLVARNSGKKIILMLLYAVGGIFFLIMPSIQSAVFEGLSGMSENIGVLLAAMVFMLPTIGSLAVISPILVEEHSQRSAKEVNSSSVVFGVSTIAGVLAILVGGLYIIPFLGLSLLMQISGVCLIVNALIAALTMKNQAK